MTATCIECNSDEFEYVMPLYDENSPDAALIQCKKCKRVFYSEYGMPHFGVV